jgi:hypothetical protein
LQDDDVTLQDGNVSPSHRPRDSSAVAPHRDGECCSFVSCEDKQERMCGVDECSDISP